MKKAICFIIILICWLCCFRAAIGEPSLSFESTGYKIWANDPTQLKIVEQDIDGVVNYSWETSDVKIAVITSNGTVIGKSSGQATITCTGTLADETVVKAACFVNVSIPVKSVEIVGDYVELSLSGSMEYEDSRRIYTTYTPTVIIKPDNATNKNLKWSTSDQEVVFVAGDDGWLAPSKVGTCIITATTTDGTNISDSYTLTIPECFVTINNIERTTKQPIRILYWFNPVSYEDGVSEYGYPEYKQYSYDNSVYGTINRGDCFTTENFYMNGEVFSVDVVPIKNGTGTIEFYRNDELVREVPVTVALPDD